MSIFADTCWRHWPEMCKCPPSEDQNERMKSDVFLLDRELQRENRRAREFSIALAALASGIVLHQQRMMAAHGEDGVPEDLFRLGEQAKQAAELLGEPRNKDRVSELLKRIES